MNNLIKNKIPINFTLTWAFSLSKTRSHRALSKITSGILYVFILIRYLFRLSYILSIKLNSSASEFYYVPVQYRILNFLELYGTV